MKLFLILTLLFFTIIAFLGCTGEKDVQVSMELAQVEKIDTIWRFDDAFKEMRDMLQVTWTAKRISYTSFENLDRGITKGTKMYIRITR